MNRIITTITIILIFLASLIIYLRFDDISAFINDYFIKDYTVVLPKENEYKRDYKYEKFNNNKNFVPYFKEDLEKIFYNFLNNGYSSITFYCPVEYTSCKEDITVLMENKILMSKINNYVNPFNSFYYLNIIFENNGSVTLTKDSLYTQDEINKVNERLDYVFNELKINELNTLEALNKIKDYMIENISYDSVYAETLGEEIVNEINSPTKASGALLLGKAVCSGYSDTFALILDRMNIPNLKISSDEHVWNLLFINNKWLHADITWSDTDNSVNLENKYFLITTEELKNLDKKEHNFDTMFFTEAK